MNLRTASILHRRKARKPGDGDLDCRGASQSARRHGETGSISFEAEMILAQVSLLPPVQFDRVSRRD